MPCQVPHLDEASSAEPDISLGIVLDDEWLIRSMLNPDHVKDGKVLPAAIPLKDLKDRGFSVNRIPYVAQPWVENAMAEMLGRLSNGMTRQSEGVACFTAHSVRKIRDGDHQVFVVIDTAQRSNAAHASIYLSDIGMKDSRARGMRSTLLPLLESRMSIEQAFSKLRPPVVPPPP